MEKIPRKDLDPLKKVVKESVIPISLVHRWNIANGSNSCVASNYCVWENQAAQHPCIIWSVLKFGKLFVRLQVLMGGFVNGGPVSHNLHSSISRVSVHRLKNFRIFMINSMPRSVFLKHSWAKLVCMKPSSLVFLIPIGSLVTVLKRPLLK